MKDIQTYLQSRGYIEDVEREVFVAVGEEETEIPFAALAGHTLESFKTLALKNGWVVEPEEVISFPVRMEFEKPNPSVRLDVAKLWNSSPEVREAEKKYIHRYFGKNARLGFSESLDGTWIPIGAGIVDARLTVKNGILSGKLTLLTEDYGAILPHDPSKDLRQTARDQFAESTEAFLSVHTPEATPDTEIHLRLTVRHLSPEEQRYFINGIAEYGKKLIDEIHICRLAKQ